MADDGLVWISGDGRETTLDDPPWVEVEWGVEGRYAPPVQVSADAVAGLDGERVRRVRAEAREVHVPLRVYGTDRADLRDRLRTLVARLDPAAGDGRLRWGDRELVCRYVDGVAGREVLDAGVTAQRETLIFRAADPYWRDADETVQTVEIADRAFLSVAGSAWLPWQLVSGDALGAFQVTNDGDRDSWPTWAIHGPGEHPRIVNETTGERIDLGVVLDAGDVVEIDTRPGAKTVVGPDGETLWPAMADDSTLWPLRRGGQRVVLELDNAEAGVSNVRLAYRRQWLTV